MKLWKWAASGEATSSQMENTSLWCSVISFFNNETYRNLKKQENKKISLDKLALDSVGKSRKDNIETILSNKAGVGHRVRCTRADTASAPPKPPLVPLCSALGFTPCCLRLFPIGGNASLLHYSCRENSKQEEPGGLQSKGLQKSCTEHSAHLCLRGSSCRWSLTSCIQQVRGPGELTFSGQPSVCDCWFRLCLSGVKLKSVCSWWWLASWEIFYWLPLPHPCRCCLHFPYKFKYWSQSLFLDR